MRLRSRPSDPAKANSSPARRHRTRGQKVLLAVLIIAALGLAGTSLAFFFLSGPGNNLFHVESPEFPDPIYSVLTGEEITDASLNSSPTYCVQIPNGTDGARPQAGLTHAAVVFEAIPSPNPASPASPPFSRTPTLASLAPSAPSALTTLTGTRPLIAP